MAAATRFLAALGFVAVLFTGIARAQDLTEFERSRYSPAAYYSYAEPGDVTMLVHVWGTVRNPGLYEVPANTLLSTVFSVAGGPSVVQRNRADQRTVTLRLYRMEGQERQLIYESTMVGEIFATPEDPVIQEGDVLTVETVVRQGLSWRDLFPVVAAVASVSVVLERVLSSGNGG